jgi:DNA polymerase-3 subunit alpha
LIKGGAFDFTSQSRAQLLSDAELIIDQVQVEKKDRLSGQISLMEMGAMGSKESLLSMKQEHFPERQPFSKAERLALEKEVLGLYVTGHPLDQYEEILKKTVNLFSNMVDNDQELEEAGFSNGQMVSIGGLITELKPMMTKKGQMMCFLTVEDLYGKIEVVVFPRVYESYRRYLKMDQPVIIKGKISYNEETSASVLADQIFPIGDLPDQLAKTSVREESSTYKLDKKVKKLYLKFSDYSQKYLIDKVKKVLVRFPGEMPVVLYFEKENKRFGANREMWIQLDDQLINELEIILGNQNVEVN